jgi:hypothetical protein
LPQNAAGRATTQTGEFAKLIWKVNSPKWDFDDATFDRTAASFDNPDYVSIVIHNYRWRLSLAEGDPHYDSLETRLAEGPVIAVPTIMLEGDANGAPHPDASAYAKKFSGTYAHRVITGASGTICLKKRRGPSPRLSSTSTAIDRRSRTIPTPARGAAATCVTHRSMYDDNNAGGADK